MPTTVSITVDCSAEPRHLVSLFGWLDRDHTLRRNATITAMTRPASEHEFENAIDIINLVLSNAIAASSLAVAFRSWRQSRPKAPPITITVNDVTITVPDASSESLAVLERALQAVLADDDDTP